jgi:hypothetical protein
MALHSARRYSGYIETHIEGNQIMNIISHMEAAFVVALSLTGSVAVFTNDAAPVTPPAISTVAAAPRYNMPTVVVSAKRMTAAEKRQSLQEESAFASARSKPVNRI